MMKPHLSNIEGTEHARIPNRIQITLNGAASHVRTWTPDAIRAKQTNGRVHLRDLFSVTPNINLPQPGSRTTNDQPHVQKTTSNPKKRTTSNKQSTKPDANPPPQVPTPAKHIQSFDKAEIELEKLQKIPFVETSVEPDDNDPLRVYCRQACKDEWILDRETERVVIGEMITAREKWCNELLFIPSVEDALKEDIQAIIDESQQRCDDAFSHSFPGAEKSLRRKRMAHANMLEALSIHTPEAGDTVRRIVDEDFHLPQWFQHKHRELMSANCGSDFTKDDRKQLEDLHETWLSHREKLIKSCTQLVIFVAAKYWRKIGGIQQFLDLIEEGNIGLMRSVDKFSLSHEVKLSTYAFWWISQAIRRYKQDTQRTVRAPTHIQAAAYKITHYEQKVLGKTGRYPTDQEIMKEFEFSPDILQGVRKFARSEISLNKPVGESGDSSLGDMIEDSHESDPTESADIGDMRDAIIEFLLTLPPGDRDKMNRYYGLGLVEMRSDNAAEPVRYELDQEAYGRNMTLEELGQVTNVTRERIRQINARSIEMLCETNHPVFDLLEHHDINLHSDEHTQANREKDDYEDLAWIDPRLSTLPLAQFDFLTRQIQEMANEGIFYIGDLVRRIIANTLWWKNTETKIILRKKCFAALKSIGLEGAALYGKDVENTEKISTSMVVHESLPANRES
jgi:RNA polymerase primary sigma factor